MPTCRPRLYPAGCADIARQLVEMKFGDGLEVAMGGGRGIFLPETAADPEDAEKKGERKDGKDLTNAWLDRYGDKRRLCLEQGAVRRDRSGQDRSPARALRDRRTCSTTTTAPKDKAGEPSLAEMAEKAIDILSTNPEGYVLMVEGGRIDHGSHGATHTAR